MSYWGWQRAQLSQSAQFKYCTYAPENRHRESECNGTEIGLDISLVAPTDARLLHLGRRNFPDGFHRISWRDLFSLFIYVMDVERRV